MKLNQNVDLGASFEKLKDNLVETAQICLDGTNTARYARAFGRLETAVKEHLVKCTDITLAEIYESIDSNPNDLKDINI